MEFDEIGSFEIADWAVRHELPRVLTALLGKRGNIPFEVVDWAIVDVASAARAVDMLRALFDRLSECFTDARSDIDHVYAVLQARSALAMTVAVLDGSVHSSRGNVNGDGTEAIREVALALTGLAVTPASDDRVPATNPRSPADEAPG